MPRISFDWNLEEAFVLFAEGNHYPSLIIYDPFRPSKGCRESSKE